MLVTLTDYEVREILRKAAEEKTQHVLGSANEEDCYFEIIAGGKEVKDMEYIEFVVNFN